MRRSPFALAAFGLLFIAAFGSLSVGIPFAIAQLTDPAVNGLGPEISVVPAIAIAYGLLSIAGAIGILLRWRRTTAFVVGTQGPVALGLLGVYVLAARDWSLLIVAAISGGAALLVLANARLATRA